MEEAYSNKRSLIWTGVIGVVISILVALCPLVVCSVKWDSSVTWAGTLGSIFGICIAIWQIVGVQKSTDAVRQAVGNTKKELEKAFSISNLSRYFEIINTIGEDIQQKDYKQALRSMKYLQDVIIEFDAIALEEIQELKPKIREAIIKIGSDIEYIQIQLVGNYGFDPENALINLNRIQKLLSEIKAKLKHK